MAEWWRGMAVNSILGALVGAAPGFGQVLALPFSYACFAVTTRRLHDLGQTGWLQLAPNLVVGAQLLEAGWRLRAPGSSQPRFDAAIQAAFAAPTQFSSLCLFAAFALWLVFALLLGAAPGVRGPNAYGEAD